MPDAGPAHGISLEIALSAARRTLAAVSEAAQQSGYYSGARTSLINGHAELRAAPDMLVKAAGPTAPTPVKARARACGDGPEIHEESRGHQSAPFC
jgi:hypothetical protein